MVQRLLVVAAVLGMVAGSMVAAPAAADVCFAGTGGAALTVNGSTVVVPGVPAVSVPAPASASVNC